MTFREFEDQLVDQTVNDSRNKSLAPFLGLTVKQLSKLSYGVSDERDKDGAVTHYVVTFHDDNPPKLLSKVKGLENGNMVILPPHVFG
ncbi:hypothetical protein CLV60_11639 [Dyadobacter jiangsuensis]|uniref:Uncharacterized protein n=1 Tax=Dyadobacter jiangsuensis TaxID=1591085 RepID=A0A2P8FP39_9BACT|nr:hypothetical protein CLV60_11639 [Dyadobacter jiangsuensis]